MSRASRVSRFLLAAVVGTIVPASGLLAGAITASSGGPCGPPVVNPVACENTLPGNPQTEWDAGTGDPSIEGFTTDISTNKGGTVHFKINTPAAAYTIAIYRMGYYAGLGGRKVATITPSVTLPQTQPSCLTDATTGLIDCGNWAESASWTVPTTAVSGVYLALLTRTDTGGDSNIPFVVRDDSSTSDILFQTSDTTWQAYNQWGGNSLYVGTAPAGRAYKVSYNRPFTVRGCCVTDNFFYGEYPMVRFLEANGYDVSYFSGVDADRYGALIKQHRVFMSVGHDEYWSGQQRANVEAARDAGVNLAFFSGNELFWKTRWENSIDGSGTSYRTLVTYKETHADAVIDPQDPPTWTGTWRDPRFSPPADGGRAENALSGTIFTVNAGTSAIQVPYQYAGLRFWRNTSVALLSPGQTATLAPSTLGYEWDEDLDNGFRPAGLLDMSSTTLNVSQKFQDYGTNVTPDTATHHLTLYRAPSGALVFGAGTVQWTWGLDSDHDDSTAPADVRMQQATVNLLADMHAQPATLQSGLVAATASTDTIPPTSTITSPTVGASIASGTAVTISGTAADFGGGVVAGVEVSTDNGSTWHPATGTTNWTYTWAAAGNGAVTLKSRAVDDSGNLETPSAGVGIMVNCPCSIWSPSTVPAVVADPDTTANELGVKFRSDVYAQVTGIRFYKATTNTGTHVGHLWASDGTLLASATFTNETASGWQQVTFANPVTISPNTTYIASYFAPAGHYSDTIDYFYPPPSPPPNFGSIVDSPPLHALRNSAGVTNGVFNPGASGFPVSDNGQATNYWVDVVVTPTNVTAPGAPTNVAATAGNSSAVVSWSAPPNGGFTISKYTITPYIGTTAQASVDITGSPPATSGVVPQLTNGTTYTFTVTATNAVGQGPASAPSNAVTPVATASVVQNGGFESGQSPWATGGVLAPSISTAKAHSGLASALLGSTGSPEPLGDSWISQVVTVPTLSSTLKFWYLPATTDSIQYDWQEAQIRNRSGTTLASIFKDCSNSQAWTSVTFDMTPYAGQTVVLWFNVHQDGSSPADPTSMYLDDVAITVNGQPTPPGAPTGVTATAGNAQATVSWTAPSNGGSPITKYTVTPYIGTTAQSPVTITGSPPATSTTIAPLNNGTTYTFTVTATNAAGTGPPSTASNPVTPAAPTAPGAPTSVTATAGNAQATVSWTAPSNGGSAITQYTVTPYIGTTAQPSSVITGSPPATSTIIAPLANGTTYSFTVTATNAVGTGPASAASNPVTPATVPSAPTGVAATAGNAQATVSWTAASDGGSPITKYTVTPYIGSTAQAPVTVTGSPPPTSAIVAPLANGTTYTFTVAATNAIGTGGSSTASNPVTPATVPGAPTNVTATAGNGQATVNWNAPSSGGSSITQYTVTPYVGTTAQPSSVVTGSPPATSTTVAPLTNGTTYTFTVTATNAIGTGPASTPSNPVTPAAPTAPAAPTNVTATAGNAQAMVSWTAPSNGGSPITQYTVTPYIGTTAQPSSVVTGSPPATSTTISPLTNGTTYTFTVTATNAIGTGSASAASNAVTPATVPGGPTNVTATAGNAQATVSWTAPANGGSAITQYTVTPFIGSTAQSPVTVTGSPPPTSAIVAPLTNGTTYSFEVTAANAIGTGAPSSASNAVTPATTPGPPTSVTAVAGNAQATVSWIAPSNGGSAITQYTVTPYIGTTAQPSSVVSGSPPATSTTVSSLINGTTYTFTVTATNAVGSGPASSASNAVTPSAAVVQNGGFENGLTGWTTGGVAPPTVTTAKAHSGTASAFLGSTGSSEPLGDSTLSQAIVVPAGAPTLTFWYWPATTDNSIIYDWQEAQIRSTSGATLASVFKVLSNAQAWTQVSFSLNAYAGTTVVLWFNVHEDGASDPSSMYLDDVAITVSTAPAAPTNVTATAGVGSATVSWTAPSNGGSPITKYTVTPYIGTTAQPSSVVTGSPPATSTTINGLTGGTTYTFTVTATNAVGTGPPSAPSNAVTPTSQTVPGSPTGVSAAAENASAVVGWTAPSNGGSPITKYTVTPYVGSIAQPSTDVVGSPPATSATITGLTNGTTYTFTISATNSVGTGPASTPSNAVIPTASATITIDTSASKDGHGSVTTAAFSTTGVGELLVAFAASDGPGSGGQTLTVSGAGLTWTLAERANTQAGTAEIWTAFATSQLSNVTVTSTQGSGGYDQSLTVLALKGASGIGGVNRANATSGAPSVSVTTTHAGSWVVGVGCDWDNAIGRTLGPNQVLEHQWVDSSAGDTFWAQAMNAQTAASGSVVQLNDTAPTSDRWNFTVVEVLAS